MPVMLPVSMGLIHKRQYMRHPRMGAQIEGNLPLLHQAIWPARAITLDANFPEGIISIEEGHYAQACYAIGRIILSCQRGPAFSERVSGLP